jgi:hypothetical protein
MRCNQTRPIYCIAAVLRRTQIKGWKGSEFFSDIYYEGAVTSRYSSILSGVVVANYAAID